MPALRLERPDVSEYNPRFQSEIASVPDANDFGELLRQQLALTVEFMRTEFGEEHAGVRYAPEKWTAREVIGHLSDCERILSYRALRFARGDETPLPGFDENAYVPAGVFERRSITSVLDEFAAVRSATVTLVDGLTSEVTTRSGKLASGPMSVRALLYLIAGHEIHHRVLLRERYLPVLAAASVATR